jgi:hypothetical protein
MSSERKAETAEEIEAAAQEATDILLSGLGNLIKVGDIDGDGEIFTEERLAELRAQVMQTSRDVLTETEVEGQE